MTAIEKPRDDLIDDSNRCMGSEYATARTYLARRSARPMTNPAGVPEHGSNDSDFAGHEPSSD